MFKESEMCIMKLFVFSIICSAIVSIAGAQVKDDPVKSIALTAVLVLSHLFLNEKNTGETK